MSWMKSTDESAPMRVVGHSGVPENGQERPLLKKLYICGVPKASTFSDSPLPGSLAGIGASEAQSFRTS